jgi:hypothetical protein
MICALISGTSTKVDGTTRQWDCVEYSGYNKDHIIKVKEQGNIRQINLDTFTGTVLTSDAIFQYHKGLRVSRTYYMLPF